MTDSKDKSFDINFFRPIAGIARDNTRIIILFIAIWAIAVFGFQFLLIATTEPTPEEALITFNELWPKVEAGTADLIEKQSFATTLLMALGKNVALADSDKTILIESLNITLHQINPDLKADPSAVATALNLGSGPFDQLIIELLPFSLVETHATTYTEELPSIMQTYCAHPRGALTDFTFLGFPFHYWYSAQFLLILFVVLCLIYAIVIERIYKKHDFVEEND